MRLIFSIMALQGIYNLLLTSTYGLTCNRDCHRSQMHKKVTHWRLYIKYITYIYLFSHPLSHVDFISVLVHLFHFVCIHRVADKCLTTGAWRSLQKGYRASQVLLIAQLCKEGFQSWGRQACALLFHSMSAGLIREQPNTERSMWVQS